MSAHSSPGSRLDRRARRPRCSSEPAGDALTSWAPRLASHASKGFCRAGRLPELTGQQRPQRAPCPLRSNPPWYRCPARQRRQGSAYPRGASPRGRGRGVQPRGETRPGEGALCARGGVARSGGG
eukprot:8241265-Alexandrium_andersonii.AAC.1